MRPFIPHKLPPTGLDWEKLSKLIGKANAAVSFYNGLLQHIPSPNALLSPVTTQEAVLSSRIEGTQASLCDVLKFEAGGANVKDLKDDIAEVINYRKALFRAVELFQQRPFIHLNMVRELHSILMSGVRGADKKPGEVRAEQNYIGRYGATMAQATYVPPSPDRVLPLLGEWENYINGDGQEVLVQLAVLHAQFEIIHPFRDGNGRLGRMLIPLYLQQKGVLTMPLFYLSQYFEEHREAYYARLLGISRDNDWQGWVSFFLVAVAEQAKTNTEKAENIFNLYEKTKARLLELTHSSCAVFVLDTFFQKPIVDSSVFKENHGVKFKSTALRIIKMMEDAGIIKTLHKGRGHVPAVYAFPELINIAEDREVWLGE